MDTLPARELKHRVCAWLTSRGWATLDEVTLPNRRRLDVCAVDPYGGIVGIETKVAEGDLRQDFKWTDYLGYVDTLYFALPSHLPRAFVQTDVGLIVSDPKKTKLVRLAPRGMLRDERRLEMLTFFARVAATRIMQSSEYIAYHNVDGCVAPLTDNITPTPSTAIRNAQEPSA